MGNLISLHRLPHSLFDVLQYALTNCIVAAPATLSRENDSVGMGLISGGLLILMNGKKLYMMLDNVGL